jgi:hypothetical protein
MIDNALAVMELKEERGKMFLYLFDPANRMLVRRNFV